MCAVTKHFDEATSKITQQISDNKILDEKLQLLKTDSATVSSFIY